MSGVEFPVITRHEMVGAEKVIAQNREIISQLRQLSTQGIQSGAAVDTLSTALKNNMSATLAQRRAVNGMRMAVRTEYAEWLEAGRALQNVGRIGQTTLSMWNSYTLGMLRVGEAQARVTDATKTAAEYTTEYNEALKTLGPNNAYVQSLAEKLADAHKKEADAIKSAADAQNSMNALYVAAAVTAIPQYANSLISLAVHLKTIGGRSGAIIGVSNAINGIGLAVTSLNAQLVGMGIGGLGALISSVAGPVGAQITDNLGKGKDAGYNIWSGTNPYTGEMSLGVGGTPLGGHRGRGEPEKPWHLNLPFSEFWATDDWRKWMSEDLAYWLTENPKVAAQKYPNEVQGWQRHITVYLEQNNNITSQADAEAAAKAAYQTYLNALAQKVGR
jgi:hypothetical protein